MITKIGNEIQKLAGVEFNLEAHSIPIKNFSGTDKDSDAYFDHAESLWQSRIKDKAHTTNGKLNSFLLGKYAPNLMEQLGGTEDGGTFVIPKGKVSKLHQVYTRALESARKDSSCNLTKEEQKYGKGFLSKLDALQKNPKAKSFSVTWE